MMGRVDTEQKEDEAARWRFAKAITARRNALNLSQVRLAQKAKLPRRMIEYLEAGERWPQMQNFMRLCRGLDVKPSVLLGSIGL